MKPPNDLWDKTPLEEEPFLSQFMIHNEIVTNRRSDNWITSLAQEVHNNPVVSPILASKGCWITK